MEISHKEVAAAQFREVDKNRQWSGAVRELKRTVVQLAQLADDLERRIAALEGARD
jgi:hypothetical protein